MKCLNTSKIVFSLMSIVFNAALLCSYTVKADVVDVNRHTDNVYTLSLQPDTSYRIVTNDTLAVYKNGYVLHELWTSVINKKVVRVTMSQPGRGTYIGLLYLKNVNEPLDILKQETIDFQYLLGYYETSDGKEGNTYYYSTPYEWGSIVKKWEMKQYSRFSDQISYTFNANGTGQMVTKKQEYKMVESTATNWNNGQRGWAYRGGTYVSTGFSYNVYGTATYYFKWKIIDKDHLILDYSRIAPKINVTAELNTELERVHPDTRKQLLAQKKRAFNSSPDVRKNKKAMTESLINSNGKLETSHFTITALTNSILKLREMHLDSNNMLVPEEDYYTTFFSDDVETLFVPTTKELEQLIDPDNLIYYDYRAEKKKMREAEELKVRTFVDAKVQLAESHLQKLLVRNASYNLQQAIDTAKAHKYDYRAEELAQKMADIQQMLSDMADTSIVMNYKTSFPQPYADIDSSLRSGITALLNSENKSIKPNQISFVFSSDKSLGKYTIAEPSKSLKKFCEKQVCDVTLKPFVAEGYTHKTSAQYNYSFEYAKSTIKVTHRDTNNTIALKTSASQDITSDLESIVGNRLKGLPQSCNGRFVIEAKSMLLNGKNEHDLELKSSHFRNGPQNAWLSLLIPGWGDKYVNDSHEFGWWATLLSYGLIGYGCYYMTTSTKDSTYVPFQVDNELNPIPEHYEYTYTKNTKKGLAIIGAGAAVWMADVFYVWIKGAKNKKENKNKIKVHLSYDVVQKAPEIVYTIKF